MEMRREVKIDIWGRFILLSLPTLELIMNESVLIEIVLKNKKMSALNSANLGDFTKVLNNWSRHLKFKVKWSQ